MKNKAFFTTLVIFIFVAGSAAAMSPLGGSSGGSDSKSLRQRLELTDEQMASLETILEERLQGRVLLHKRHHDELEQHRVESRERLSTVLTQAQIEQLEAYRLWHERAGRAHLQLCSIGAGYVECGSWLRGFISASRDRYPQE
ncbi:MAG: hypothetical protein ABW080_03700 [Candidatus Thiodiazotropha sp.]